MGEITKQSLRHSIQRTPFYGKERNLSVFIEFDCDGDLKGIYPNASTDLDEKIIKRGLKRMLKRNIWTRRRGFFS